MPPSSSMCASTMTRGPCVPCVATIEPSPSNVTDDASGLIKSTSTLRIGSAKPGGPGVSVSCWSSATVRSCARDGEAAATMATTTAARVLFMPAKNSPAPHERMRAKARRYGETEACDQEDATEVEGEADDA